MDFLQYEISKAVRTSERQRENCVCDNRLLAPHVRTLEQCHERPEMACVD
jgi:hypothetical protein